MCVSFPCSQYGTETLLLTKAFENKLREAQRAMGRSTLGITRRDRMTKRWIRQQLKDDLMAKLASLELG